jgi:hypothetical protein
MAAGLVVPISGPYVGTWNALPLGTLSDDGYELGATLQGQEVNETDAYGMTLVEAIYRGFNWRLRIRALELTKTGPLTLFQQFGQTGAAGTLNPQLVNIGDRWTKYSLPLVLTAILGNPPSSPASLTAVNAAIAPNSSTSMLFTSKVREMPVELVLIPYTVSGPANIPFSTT